MRNFLILIVCALTLSSCFLKKIKAKQTEYVDKAESLVHIWYQNETTKLQQKRDDQLDSASIVLPEYNKIKDLQVVLWESIERINQEYDSSRATLDSLMLKKTAEIKLLSK
ncbi:MAG: hypothetical protein ABJF11_03280 [Reichenbachiella sp.]|uniref:hypothetical protein n=1 Tax=Reichenbachiella sp. TaxID=2184521 RepID=UPI0032673AA0